MIVEGAVVMIENIVRTLSHPENHPNASVPVAPTAEEGADHGEDGKEEFGHESIL